MKYAVYPETSVTSIPRDADAIHLVRPIPFKRLGELMQRCSSVRELFLPKSCEQRLPKKTRDWLKERGIALRADSKKGRAIEVPLEKVSQLTEWKKDLKSYREIEKELGVAKSTAHYLVKYAVRTKIKKGNQIVYLK